MMASLRAQLSGIRDRILPRHMCAKKKRYLTLHYAERIRKLRQPLSEETLHIYRCPECRGYHLTKLEQP